MDCGKFIYVYIDHSLMGHIGSGVFGDVERGIWKHDGSELEVALKILKSDSDKINFLKEAVAMAQFQHPNVVFLHGVVSREQPVSKAVTVANRHCYGNIIMISMQLMLVVEFVHKGDLKNYLLSMRSE